MSESHECSSPIHITVIASLMLNRMVEMPSGKKNIIHNIVTLNIQRHLIVLFKLLHWHINHLPVKTQMVQGATNSSVIVAQEVFGLKFKMYEKNIRQNISPKSLINK